MPNNEEVDPILMIEPPPKLLKSGIASLLQRKLKLGYNRAGRIVDQLEATGIIGPHRGSKARDVLIPDLVSLEQFLTNLREKGKL